MKDGLIEECKVKERIYDKGCVRRNIKALDEIIEHGYASLHKCRLACVSEELSCIQVIWNSIDPAREVCILLRGSGLCKLILRGDNEAERVLEAIELREILKSMLS